MSIRLSGNRVDYACGCISWLEWNETDHRWWKLWSRDSRCKADHEPAFELFHLYGECYGDPRDCPQHRDDPRNGEASQ